MLNLAKLLTWILVQEGQWHIMTHVYKLPTDLIREMGEWGFRRPIRGEVSVAVITETMQALLWWQNGRICANQRVTVYSHIIQHRESTFPPVSCGTWEALLFSASCLKDRKADSGVLAMTPGSSSSPSSSSLSDRLSLSLLLPALKHISIIIIIIISCGSSIWAG